MAITTITYQTECIKDNVCAASVAEAALYDYVGAVYGEEGKVKYDGKLTPDERAYVEQKFGKFSGDKRAFITQAQQISVQRHSTPATSLLTAKCNNWPIEFQRYSHQKMGKGSAIGGTHGCAQIMVGLYLNQGVEQEVAANPGAWVFFIEGLSDFTTKPDHYDLPELPLFVGMANALGIPVREALVPMDDPSVLAEAEKRSKGQTSRRDFIVAIAVVMSKEAFSNPLISEEDAIDIGVEVTADRLRVDREKLKRDLDQFFVPPITVTDQQAYFDSQRKLADERYKALEEIGNEKSVELIRAILKATGKPNAFFLMGRRHMWVVTTAYQPEK